MEFCHNFTRIKFWEVIFVPTKYCNLCLFHFKNIVIPKNKYRVYCDFEKMSFNLHIKPPVLHPFSSHVPQQITKKPQHSNTN